MASNMGIWPFFSPKKTELFFAPTYNKNVSKKWSYNFACPIFAPNPKKHHPFGLLNGQRFFFIPQKRNNLFPLLIKDIFYGPLLQPNQTHRKKLGNTFRLQRCWQRWFMELSIFQGHNSTPQWPSPWPCWVRSALTFIDGWKVGGLTWKNN